MTRPGVLRATVLTLVVAASLCFGGTAVAAPWCGTVAAADRPQLVGGKPIRVVYAIPADGTDRSAQRAAQISADVDSIAAWWRNQDSARAPRFDLAAFPCGAQADIQLLVLPQSGADLMPTEARFAKIAEAVAGLGPQPLDSKYLVYYDGPVADPDVCGQGGGSADGQGVAIVLFAGCPDIPSDVTAAHELIHSFGALPDSGPPHACPGDSGHPCDSTGDILYPYASFAQLGALGLDVGRDDYYGHSGSWLDVQDSQWLRHLEAPPVTLAVTPSGGGSVQSAVPGVDCPIACTVEWDGGSQVVLQATAQQGKRFVRWSGACSGQTDCLLTLAATATVGALFAPESYRLTVSVAGKGTVRGAGAQIVCPGRCSAGVESYSPVALRALPARGWKLKRWSGACRGSTPTCRLPMSAVASARATFVRK